MTGRVTTILAAFGSVALVLAGSENETPSYVWNASESVPIGLYRLQPDERLSVTDLVAIRPPEPLATFLDLNGYLPVGVLMLVGGPWPEEVKATPRLAKTQLRWPIG